VELKSQEGELIVELELEPEYDWLPAKRETLRYLFSAGEIRQLASWRDFGQQFWWVEAIDQVSYFGSAVPWSLGAGPDFLAVNGGCNRFRLPASFSEGRLRVLGPPELLGKPRSCLSAVSQLENYFLELLQGAERLEWTSNRRLELVTRLAGQERRVRFTPKRWKFGQVAPNPIKRQGPPGFGPP
jgi:heat shock protein HslJ